MSPSAEDSATPAATRARLPRQIAYIIGNEGCERFSFYGMRNILTQFLVSSALLFTATEALSQPEREGDPNRMHQINRIAPISNPLQRTNKHAV